MAHDQGAAVNEWINVVRRARLPATTKLVALLVASYADPDGTNIYPGIARLAVQSGKGYRSVERALASMRAMQLIEKMPRAGMRRGWSARYRLILGADVLEKVDVMTPAAEELAAEGLRSLDRMRHRGKHRRNGRQPVDNSPQDGTTTRHPDGGQSDDHPPLGDPTTRHSKSADQPERHTPSIDLYLQGNPPTDDGQVSMPRTGSGDAGESDDHPPDTYTRRGTEEARQAAADALTAWMRDHPEACDGAAAASTGGSHERE